MGEDIRDLIEKINQDGIKAAEEKARNIEASAMQRAESILGSAKREAEEMSAAARERIRREDERGKILLSQAGRDLLLSLRKEINVMLERIVESDIQQALTPEVLSRILVEAVRNYHGDDGNDIKVVLNTRDRELIEQHYLNKLTEEIRKKVFLSSSEEISGGFTISFDSGKSCFDFTDTALAEFICTNLKPKLNQILTGAAKE